jgi:hypothetical protein
VARYLSLVGAFSSSYSFYVGPVLGDLGPEVCLIQFLAVLILDNYFGFTMTIMKAGFLAY